MIRFMIVDDDSIICKGLSQKAVWSDFGFELIGTAEDGEEALRFFVMHKPEIVITDIKMPFMNGLELSRRILQEEPKTKIIMLTGYEEFEYAKQALELRVFNYLLKPVTTDQLLDTLRHAAEALEKEKKIQRQIYDSHPLLQQRFLTRLVFGKFHSELEISEEAAFLGLTFNHSRYIALVVKIDEYFNTQYFLGIHDQEIIKWQIRELCQEAIPLNGGEVFDPGGDELVLIIGGTIKPGEMTQNSLEFGKDLLQRVNEIFHASITIGIGSSRDCNLDIATSYREAKAATEFRHIIGKNQVLTIGDTGMPIEEPFELPKIDEDLTLKLKLGLADESLALVDNLEQRLLGQPFVPLSTARLIGMKLAVTILKEMEVWKHETILSGDNFLFNCCRPIQEGQTIEEIFSALRRLMSDVAVEINKQRESCQNGISSQAIRFIEDNYTQEGLSLPEVAEVIHVSPVYLSVMFKKERNINFSDFLTEVRMKKAMELLRNTDLKTYEVAEMVGYSNPRYFSVCFKKYSGFSPSDFKQNK